MGQEQSNLNNSINKPETAKSSSSRKLPSSQSDKNDRFNRPKLFQTSPSPTNNPIIPSFSEGYILHTNLLKVNIALQANPSNMSVSQYIQPKLESNNEYVPQTNVKYQLFKVNIKFIRIML